MRLNSAATYSPAFSFPPEILVFGGLRVGRIDEHAMMLAFDLFEAIAERIEENVIGADDFAGRGEFDDPLNARDRVELGLEFRVPELLRSDVGRNLDDLHDTPFEFITGL